MSRAAAVSDRCRQCGAAIAPLPAKAALCVRCRYHAPRPRVKRGPSEFEVAEATQGRPDDRQGTTDPDAADLEDLEAEAPGQDPAGAVRRGRELAVSQLLAFLLGDEAPAAEVGARVLALAYALHLPGAPETQRALARRCRLGLATANKLCRQNAGLFQYFAGRREQGRPW